MRKKLFALLLALTLLMPAALAESRAAQPLFPVIREALDADGIYYGTDEEYACCYFAVDLKQPSILGTEVYMDVYAYDTGVNIICSYAECPPEAAVPELIVLCNGFSSSVYMGKFYVDPQSGALTYELFIPMDPTDVRPFDRALITDFLWQAVSTLDFYQEYFLMVIEDGEKAANVLAIWDADTE